MEAGGQGGQAGGQEAKEEVKKAKAESEAKASTSTAQAGDFKAVLPLLSFGFAALRDGRAAQRQRDCRGGGRADSNMLVPVPSV